jgi:hypothetical protein
VLCLLVTSLVGVLRIGISGFRRTPLVEKGAEHHVEAHLQELALPVLEDGLYKVAASQVLDVANRFSPVLLLGAVVVEEAHNALPAHEDEEKSERGDRESVVTQ